MNTATHHTLSQRASFWVAAAVVAHTLWTSAAPAMTYPLYGAEWHLSPVVTTAIFAVYPLFVVGVLILFGDMSDYIGRRATMLFGLAASMIGVLLFAVASNVYWIFLGRAFMGIGVGLSASPSAAALVEFSPAAQSKRAGSITTAAQSLGLALATLVGGALIEYAPFPTRLNFWVLFAVIAVIFTATWFLPRHTSTEASGPWRPKIPRVPQSLYKIFATSTVAITIGYALGAIMMSLGAHIAHDLIGSNNRLVNGAAMSLLAITSGIAAVSGKRLAPSFSMLFGGLASLWVWASSPCRLISARSPSSWPQSPSPELAIASRFWVVSTSSMPTPPSIIAAGPFQRYWSLPTSFKEPSRFSWASPPRRGDLESRLILVQLPSPCLAQ